MAISVNPSVSGLGASSSSSSSGAGPAPYNVLPAVTCGNSISANGFFLIAGAGGTNTFDPRSELASALAFQPIGYYQKSMASSGIVVDVYGNYGNSGATLFTIMNDLGPTWVPALLAGGVTPGIVCGTALLENDIAANATVAQCLSRFDAWINFVQAQWPGVTIQANTPHPDTRLNTAQLQANWFAVRAGMLARDNGASIFITDLAQAGGCCTPGNLSQPLPGVTYDGILHPNPLGASLNARLMAKEFKRISARLPNFQKPFLSTNMGLLGSVAVSGTGYSGTVPSPYPIPPLSMTAGSVVFTAGNPGALNGVYTPQNLSETVLLQMPFTSNLPSTRSLSWAKLRLNSGAANVAAVYNIHQFVSTPAYNLTNSVSDPGSTPYSYQDGDILYLITPAVNTPTSTTQVNTNIVIKPIALNTAINFDLLAQGYINLS